MNSRCVMLRDLSVMNTETKMLFLSKKQYQRFNDSLGSIIEED